MNETLASIAQADPKEQALKLLKALLPSQVDHVVLEYGVNPAYLAANASQVQTAVATFSNTSQKPVN